MANARVVTYECELCGSEIVVTETMETKLSPIYCCGVEVTETIKKKPANPQKKTAKKKVAKKKTITKKKPASKKKTSRK